MKNNLLNILVLFLVSLSINQGAAQYNRTYYEQKLDPPTELTLQLKYTKWNKYKPLLLGVNAIYEGFLDNRFNLLGAQKPQYGNKTYFSFQGNNYYYEDPCHIYTVKMYLDNEVSQYYHD